MYTVEFDGTLLEASTSSLVEAAMRSCTLRCSAEQAGFWLDPGTSKDGDEVPERLLPDGPYRVEVRSELGDLPVDEPGVFTMQRVGP